MRVLLDLDGVLVNFVKGCCELHGKRNPYTDEKNRGIWNLETLFGIELNQFWNGMEHAFWANLEPMDDAFELLEIVESIVPQKDICILSSPTRNPGCIPGKIAWIERFIPQYRRRFLIGPKKDFCANIRHILIDDYDKNVEDFRKAGGRSILVPRLWNTLHAKAGDTLSTVKEELCTAKSILG